MAASGNVLADDSLVSRLDRKLLVIERVFALISGVAVLSLMFLAVFSVSGRNFFNAPLPGYVDWIEQAMPLIAFMGISFVQREGGHIRMDLLIGNLRGRVLWIVEFISVFFILTLMLLLVWGSWSHFGRSVDILPFSEWAGAISAGEYSRLFISRDSSMDIAIPLWPAKLVVPLAFAVLCMRLVLQLISYAKAIASGNRSPVAVPLIETAAEQAAREARSVSGVET